jgi:peroxiredoxin Q/BCP
LSLEIGDMISGFADKVENGLKNCLADFKGKKVISYFYPKDMTLNFMIETSYLRATDFDILFKGILIIEVSADDEHKHEQFLEVIKN